MRLIASAVTVLGLGISAAQSAESCEGTYGFEEEGYAAAKVKSKRSYFLADDGAPLKPYVVRGDEVLITGRKEGAICAVYYSGKGNETSGWLKSDDFDISEKPELKPRDWVGKWSKGEWGNLELSAGKNDWLSVSGDALWAANAEAMKNGGVNVGEVAGNAPVENGILGFTMTGDETYLPFSGAKEFDCAIRLRMVGENYLLAEDNNNCGGHNVSFTGLYARAN
jgi:hypothetical protein